MGHKYEANAWGRVPREVIRGKVEEPVDSAGTRHEVVNGILFEEHVFLGLGCDLGRRVPISHREYQSVVKGLLYKYPGLVHATPDQLTIEVALQYMGAHHLAKAGNIPHSRLRAVLTELVLAMNHGAVVSAKRRTLKGEIKSGKSWFERYPGAPAKDAPKKIRKGLNARERLKQWKQEAAAAAKHVGTANTLSKGFIAPKLALAQLTTKGALRVFTREDRERLSTLRKVAEKRKITRKKKK